MKQPEREQAGRELCRNLVADIAAISPSGLGSWLPDRHPARTAADDFMAVLVSWEAGKATAAAVQQAYDQVLEAWRRAAEAFRAESEARAVGGGR